MKLFRVDLGKTMRAVMAAGLGLAFLLSATPPAADALVSKTDGLHMSRSAINSTYHGCSSSYCADSDSQISNAIASATISEGTVNQIRFDNNYDADNFHLVYRGYFYADKTNQFGNLVAGSYGFATESDDMSYVWVGSDALNPTYANATVKNQGLHGRDYVSGVKFLEPGKWYPILILFGERSGGAALDFYWSKETSLSSKPASVPTLPASNFRHSGAQFFTSISDPGFPDLSAASDSGASNSDNITGNGTLVFTGSATANAKVEYSFSNTNTVPSAPTGQCTVSSTTYTCTVSGYTGDTRYFRARQYDDYSNVSNWTSALTVQGLTSQSLTNLSDEIAGRQFSSAPRVQIVSAGSAESRSGVSVTASISSGSLTGTTTVTTDANGIATFSDLGLAVAAPGGDVTLTFSPSGYQPVTETFSSRVLPTRVTISSAASSNGSFINGVWYADTAAASVVNASALATELASRSVLIEVDGSPSDLSQREGSIFFDAEVVKSAGTEQTLTLKATRSVDTEGSGAGVRSSSGPLNLVFWTDSDGDGAGAIRFDGPASGWLFDTNGGHFAIGGGATSTTWNGLTIPAGYAASDVDKGTWWWGVELGVNQANADMKLIRTGGGDLKISGESNEAAGVTQLYGIAWEGGEINTGAGEISFAGRTVGNPTSSGADNFGLGLGLQYATAADLPKLVTAAPVSITGTTSSTASGHGGVYLGEVDFDADSSLISASSDRKLVFGSTATIRSPLAATSTGAGIEITGAQTWNGTSNTLTCVSGPFSNSAAGVISTTGSLTTSCDSITTSGVISAGGPVSLESVGASSITTIAANITTTNVGSDLLLKSKSNVLIDTSGVTLQTAGADNGSGGRIILWSDSDASGQGFIKIARNATLNSIGGSTSTFTGGGNIHLAGGLDDGTESDVSPNASAGDGLPDGWAISSQDFEMGIQFGFNAISGDLNSIQSGGGDIKMFGKNITLADAIAFNWTTRMDSGEGQIELRADSAGWGLQLNRSGDNDVYSTKSVFTSRSNAHPAISMHAKSATTGGEVALLGSWGDVGKDNLLLQALGVGGVNLVGDAPSTTRAPVSLTSTAILSTTGDITIDGGSRGIHFGRLSTGHNTWGDVTLGSCETSICVNSQVTSSNANVNLIGDRIATVDASSNLNTFINTSGFVSVLPAQGSQAFADFQTRTAGLTLAQNLGGLQIGRIGDTTAGMTLAKNWKIAGPITVNAGDILISGNVQLETTDEATSDIRLVTNGRIYSATGVALVTNGSNIVLWTGFDKVAGTNKPGTNIYLDPISITTNGGKIWLAGGRDDGGQDAQITDTRGKWSSVVAEDGLPDGYATGRNTDVWDQVGVLINRGSVLNSGGGDIFIAGASGPSGGGYAHIGIWPDVKIDSGSGRIAMWGRSLGPAQTHGIRLNWDREVGPVLITSNAPTADAISIYSDSSAAAGASPGITAWEYAPLNAQRVYQGNQIAATASGGGITLTGIGSASNVAGANGMNLDFIDIFAIDGPITLNGDSTASNNGSVGVAFGWVNNISSVVRLGGWTAGTVGGTSGNIITTVGGVTADFSQSSSDVTINTDSFWNGSGSQMNGVYLTTSGNFSILPTNLTDGLIAPVDSFKATQNGTDWSFEKLSFQRTPESVTIGRQETTTSIRMLANLEAHGDIQVYGSALDMQGNLNSKSGRGDILVKSTSTIKLAANKTYQTNGSDIVLWATSAGGNGFIEVGDGACVNTNASCDVNVSTATGSIYMGGGSAGTDFPTGPVIDSGYRGVRLATTAASGVKLLSGGGDIVLRGQSNLHGVEIWNGVTIKTTAGAIVLDGTSTSTGHQGVRIAGVSGTSVLSSGKTSGTAISITGANTNAGSDTASSSSNAVFIGDDESVIEATGGGDIVVSSNSGAVRDIRSFILRDSSVSVVGGDVLFVGGATDVVRTSIVGSGGSRIQVKSTSHIFPDTSTFQTAGPGDSGDGTISLWVDSDGNNQGVFHTGANVCVNTIGTCTSPTTSGGADIFIGGGSSADDSGFFPSGGAPSVGSWQGILLGNTDAANQFKLWSGGGDIAIRSKSTSTTSGTSGQYWYGGTSIHSGDGAIVVENTAGATGAINTYGIDLRANGHPISIISEKASGDAIKFESAVNTTGRYASPILIHDGSSSIRTTISATGGGNVVMEGTAAGTNTDTYSFAISNADILASSGDITLSGNRGVWLNSVSSSSSNFGATSSGTASGNIVISGNRLVLDSSARPTNFKTSGTLTIRPLTGESFLHSLSFPSAGYSLTGITGLQVGAQENTANLTVAQAASVAGPITYEGGPISVNAALTSTGSGAVSLISSSTVSQAADIISGTGGVFVKSAGKVSIEDGTSVANPRKLSSASGPITIWTTGTSAGVDIGNYVLIETNADSSAGADITIGGGTADPSDSSRPSGNTTTSSGTALQIGGASSNAENLVRIFAGSGDISLKAETTHASASSSGINLSSGVKIVGATVDIYGKARGTTNAGNDGSGVFFYRSHGSSQTLIEATASFDTHTTALEIDSEMVNGAYGIMLSNMDSTGSSEQIKVMTSGQNADMRLAGKATNGWSGGQEYSFQTAALLLSTNTGNVTIDGNGGRVSLSRGTTRLVAFEPNSGGPGGDITVITDGIDSHSAGILNIQTAGKLSVIPPEGESFATPTTFPLTGSQIQVGGLVVGSAENTADLIQGSAITSSGDVTYLGGSQTANFTITTTSAGDITFLPTGTFSKSTNAFTSARDIKIGSEGAPATTITTGGTLFTAARDIEFWSSSSLTQSGEISAGNRAVLGSTLVDVNVNRDITAGSGGILLKARQDIKLNAGLDISTSSGGDIVIWASSTNQSGLVDTGSNTTNITSSGGDIVIAGGLDNGANGGIVGDQIPDNPVRGPTNSSEFTVRLDANMNSGAGDILVRSKFGSYTGTSSLGAVLLSPSVVLETSTGDIQIYGEQNIQNTSSRNHYGLWLGLSTDENTQAQIISTSGNILLSGDASASNASNRRGIVFYSVLVSTGGDVTILGASPTTTGSYDFLGWYNSKVYAGGDILLTGNRTSALEFLEFEAVGKTTFIVGSLKFGDAGANTSTSTTRDLMFSGSGTVEIVPRLSSFSGNLTVRDVSFASTLSGLLIGKSSNVYDVSFEADPVSIAGQIQVLSDTVRASTALASTASNISLTTDILIINTGSPLSASAGAVEVKTITDQRPISLGSEQASHLSLSTAELSQITATTLRFSTTGNIDVTASHNFTGQISTLALRAGGDVTGSAGVLITVANLGIEAGGTISFPGNQAASVIALNATSITYNQTATYDVSVVDGIDPEFGFGVKFAIANVPVDETFDEFMAVAFNPPPTVKILDKFDNVIAANNLSAGDFVVTPTLNVTSTSSGTLELTGTSPAVTAGTHVFSSLAVTGGTGTATITFSATRDGVALTENSSLDTSGTFTVQASPTFITSTYNIQAGEPQAISIAWTSLSAPAGKTGFGLVATLKDSGSNTVSTGPHADATVTVSISGEGGVIEAGSSADAVNGVANFSALEIGGTVGTDYTLAFSVTYTDTQSESQTVTQDQVVTLTPGDATKLDASPTSQTKPTASPLDDITVSVLDAYDNLVTSATDAITVTKSAGSNGGSATLAGYSAPVPATGGQVVFSTLGINGTSGDYTLTFSSGSLTADTHEVTITHGVADRIELVAPATAKNDIALDSQPVVTVYDPYNNIVESFTGEIVLTATGATAGGALSMDAVDGVADFAGKGVTLTGVVGSKTLTATAASLNKTDSSNVTLEFGSATSLAITTQAAGFVNRTNFTQQPIVKVQDVSANTVEDFAGDVELSIGSGATITGTTSLTLTAAELGVASFQGLGLQGTVGNYTITASSTGLTDATQPNVNLTHGDATEIKFVQQGSGARSGELLTSAIQIEVVDADSNRVTTGSDATAVFEVTKTEGDYAADPAGATFGGSTTTSAEDGLAEFTDLTLSGVAQTYNLTITPTSPASSAALTALTQTLQLAAGDVDRMQIVGDATDAQAGVDFSPEVSVELLDAWNNRVLADSTTSVSANLVNPENTFVRTPLATATGSSGLVTFTGLDVTIKGTHKIRFTSSGLADVVSSEFEIVHGPASKIVFSSTQPTSARSGINITPSPTFQLLDEFNNGVISGPLFTVTATVVSANSGDVDSLTGASQTSSAGTEIVQFNSLNLTAPEGTYKLRFSATDGTDSFFVETGNITLGFGLPHQLSISQSAATARAGEAFGTLPIVEIQDSAGNVVADSTLTVVASVAGKTLVGTDSVPAVNGVADFASSTLGIAGTVADALTLEFAIEYPAESFITTSQSIDLVAGPTRYIHIVDQPTELVTRGTFSPGVELELRDQYQNKVLSDSTTTVSAVLYDSTDQVATATAGESAISAAVQTAVNGEVDFSALTFAVPPGDGYYLRFSLPASLDIELSDAFAVVPGVVASIEIDTQPSTINLDNSLVMTGELLAQMPSASLYDQDGYLADNAAGSVVVSIASGSNGDLSEGETSATISAGTATFSGVRLVGTPAEGATPAEQYNLTFSFAGVDSAPSNALSVTHNVAHKLVLARDASGGRAGEVFSQQPIVEIQDRYDNIVESSSAAIRVGASAGGSVTGREVNAQAGIARFTGLALGGLTTNTYSLTFEIPNTSVQTFTQTDITLTFGVADSLQLFTPPVSLDANSELTKTGDALFGQPVVRVLDAHGNVVENSSDIVTVGFVATFDARDRLENATATSENGVAAFQDLTLIARPGQDYRLNFTSGTLTNTQSENLQVRHADPDSIEIVIQPSAVIDAQNGVITRTGSALHVQPEIRILDFDGNYADTAAGVNVVATVASGDGEALTDDDGSGRPLNEAVISGGVASFSQLKLVAAPGVSQEVQFSAAFPTGTVLSENSTPLVLTNGLAQSLAMETEPCAGADNGNCAAGITGEQLEVQPTVKVLDAFGNLVIDHVGEVVAAVSAEGARLSVADSDDVTLRTAQVVGGYAAFGGLELTATPGANVKINFSSDSLIGVSSRDLVVAAANAANLQMVVQPVGERTGSELATQPQLRIVDRFGNTVLSDSTTEVTVTESGGTLFTDPESPLTAIADQGVVSFSSLRFTGVPLTPYELTFTASGVSPITSSSFQVTNAFANNLVITQQPVSGKTGDLLTQMPVLELRDFDDNLAEDDDGTVATATIDVSNGAAQFVDEFDQPLGATPTATAVGGVVTFENLRIVAIPGTVYKLNFEADPENGPNFQSLPSAELVFTHANPAKLVVTQSAIGGLAGEDLTVQPELEVLDRFDNLASSDSLTSVTAVIETGVSGDVLRGATAVAENGIVRFTALALDGVPSQTYTLGFNATTGLRDSFRVVDTSELSLSRPATLTLSIAEVAYSPDQSVSPVFTTDSAGLVTWSTTSENTVCVLELDGNNDPTGNLIVNGVGTCTLRAEVAREDFAHANAPLASYLPNEVSANLVITKAAQESLTISSANNVDYRGSLTLSVSGGSGTGEIRYFVSGDCRVIGGVLLPGEAGANCEVFARKLGDANYLQIDSATEQITVNRIAQSPLRIGNGRDVAVGDITLFTSGGTGTGEVSFQVSTTGDAQCQIIEGNILRASQNGTCGVMATKQPSANYLVAISPELTFTFSKMSQVVNFTSTIPTRPMPGILFEPIAEASSGLAVTISITGGIGTVCEFDSTQPTKVRFLVSGNCVLTATQAGSSQFNAASSALTIAVNAMNQTISFAPISNKIFGEPKFQLAATASSGLPVSYAVGQTFQNPGCTVSSSGMVTLVAAGMCEIVASQPGDASYLAAPDITQIFNVSPDQAGAPRLVSVSVSNQAITAKFRAPSYLGGSQVSAYRLEATNGDGDTYVNPGCLAQGADLVCDLVGIPLNTPYTVKIAAVTAAGIGVYSEDSLPVMPGNTEIAVMQLSADQSGGQLEISWEQPLAFDGEFISYDIYVWPLNTEIPDQPTQSIGSQTAKDVTFSMSAQEEPVRVASIFNLLQQSVAIPEANSYNIKVVTITDNSSIAMTDVNVASGVQIGAGVPGRPRNELLEADGQKLRVVWSEPQFDGGEDVTHYMIRKSGEEAAPCQAIDPVSAPLSGKVNDNWNYSLNQPSALIFEQTGLSAGLTYEIAVFACNSEGASEPTILTHSIPAPPPPFIPPVTEEEELEDNSEGIDEPSTEAPEQIPNSGEEQPSTPTLPTPVKDQLDAEPADLLPVPNEVETEDSQFQEEQDFSDKPGYQQAPEEGDSLASDEISSGATQFPVAALLLAALIILLLVARRRRTSLSE